MERRLFLKQVASVIGVSLLNPGKLISQNGWGTNNVWESILEYGRHSPSPHNLQPWKVKLISETAADLYYDPSRLIPVSDKENKFLTLAMGVFIETCAIKAAGMGFLMDFKDYNLPVESVKSTPQFFGKLSLQKKETKIEFDPELILQRKTSRLHYQPKPVDSKILESINETNTAFNHTFSYSSNCKMVTDVLELNRDTLFEDLNNTLVRDELKQWLRYSQASAQKTKDGLWSHCMNFPSKFMRSFFNHPTFYNHGLVKKIIDKYYLHSMAGTKTIGWINGPIDTHEHCIQAGRYLARLWLQLTKHNIYIHPFGSVITNKKALTKFIEISSCGQDCWLLFRMGYSQTPPKSYRLSVNDILLKS